MAANMEQTEQPAQPRKHRAPIDRAAAAYPRKKISNACQVCRARRTRCDEERPCGFCRKTGSTCVSSPSTTTNFDPASLRILERIDDLQSDLSSFFGSIQGLTQSPVARLPSANIAHQPQMTVAKQSLPRSMHPQNLESLFKWGLWEGLDPPHLRPQHSPGSAASPMDSGLGSDSDAAISADYLQAFFKHVHVENPILDEQAVRATFRTMDLNGVGWAADSCLLLLILANGCLATPFGDQENDRNDRSIRVAQSLYAAAQKRFGVLVQSDYLTQAKCSFYSGVYLMSMLRPFDAWRDFLQGLATCQAFRTMLPGTLTETSNHAEESVYWSCWKSERELRIELGLPDFTTTGLDHPRLFPSLPLGCEGDNLRAWYFYLAEISLWRIETTTRKEIDQWAKSNKLADLEALATYVNGLEEPVLSWKSSLPPAISLGEPDEYSRDILRFVLQGRLTYIYEVFTWPFLFALLHGHCHGSLADELATKGLHIHLDRLITNRPGFFYRHHGTWLMQRSSARSACLLLAAARTLSSNALPFGWAENVWATIEMLEYWRYSPGGLGEIADFMRNVMSHIT